MARRLRPIAHEDRLSVVDHLDELRHRLIISAVVLIAAFAVCFAGSHQLINLLNAPYHDLGKRAANHLAGTTGDEAQVRRYLLNASGDATQLARSPEFSLPNRAYLAALSNNLELAGKALPRSQENDPVTLGVGEPFTASLKVALYFALIISLPVLLYEAFAFVVPALTQRERRVVTPLLIAAPALFFAGAVFAYVIVLPAAIKFLQGYNGSEFQSFVQAGPLYSFEALTMAAIGLAFEMPLFLLGLRAAGIINGSTLTTHWRYAAVIIAVIAAAMPGADPVTTGLETAPLVILFIISVIIMKYLDRRAARREARDALATPGIGLS